MRGRLVLPVALVHVEPLRTHCGRFPRALAHPPHNQRRSLCDGARGWHFSATVGGRSPPPAERAAAGQRHVCARHRCGSPTAERPPPEPARTALRSIAAGLRFLHMAPRVGAEAARWTRRLTRGSGVQPPYHRPVRACSMPPLPPRTGAIIAAGRTDDATQGHLPGGARATAAAQRRLFVQEGGGAAHRVQPGSTNGRAGKDGVPPPCQTPTMLARARVSCGSLRWSLGGAHSPPHRVAATPPSPPPRACSETLPL